jgi:hypothetical protein
LTFSAIVSIFKKDSRLTPFGFLWQSNVGRILDRKEGNTMSELVRRQVCKCEHCGNEAEMVVTCTLPDADAPAAEADTTAGAPRRVLGHATCSHCGNEADMWIDL